MPETIPALQTILANVQEDRFVRMSAAYGLAQLGESQGVNGLEQIFTESEADGRGHSLAFRTLTSLNNAQSLPLMREIATSEYELRYRLEAMRFLGKHNDHEAIPALQHVAASPHEQPSVRQAAEAALSAITQGK